jgi:hypothetical protein
VLGDLFYQLGTVLGGLDSHLPGKHGAGANDEAGPSPSAPPAASAGPATPDADHLDGDLHHVMDSAGGVMTTAAVAWLAGRVLRPRPVRWTRVVLAGVAATVIADVVARTLDARSAPPRPLFDDDPEMMLRRFGGGIAMAAGYAALVYPRLPGPPLLRGLAFGALEVAAAPRGGLARMAAETPTLRFPLQNLALPLDEDELATPLSRLAFGLGLGLFYQDLRAHHSGDDDLEDYDED